MTDPPSTTCWSCGGARHAGGVCPWCGARQQARALTPEQAAAEEARRQRVLRRAAVVTAIVVIVGAAGTAGSMAWQSRQRDNDWKSDARAIARTTAQTVAGLPLDPAAPDPTALRRGAGALFDAAGQVVLADHHVEDRAALSQQVTTIARAIESVATVAGRSLGDLGEADTAEARNAWGGLADEADAIFEVTGVKVDVAAAQAKVTVFVDDRMQRARTEQRVNAARTMKAQLADHRAAVERVFTDYEQLRLALERERLGDRETTGFYAFDVIDILNRAGDERMELSSVLAKVGGLTPALTERVQRMADTLQEMGARLAGATGLEGSCRFTDDFQFVCERMGDLPEYKRLVTDLNALHRRLMDEKKAWAAEVDAETAKADQQLATATP